MIIVCFCWLKLQKLDFHARNEQYKIRRHFYCSVNSSSISLKEGNVTHNLAMQAFEKREFNFFTKMR